MYCRHSYLSRRFGRYLPEHPRSASGLSPSTAQNATLTFSRLVCQWALKHQRRLHDLGLSLPLSPRPPSGRLPSVIRLTWTSCLLFFFPGRPGSRHCPFFCKRPLKLTQGQFLHQPFMDISTSGGYFPPALRTCVSSEIASSTGRFAGAYVLEAAPRLQPEVLRCLPLSISVDTHTSDIFRFFKTPQSVLGEQWANTGEHHRTPVPCARPGSFLRPPPRFKSSRHEPNTDFRSCLLTCHNWQLLAMTCNTGMSMET